MVASQGTMTAAAHPCSTVRIIEADPAECFDLLLTEQADLASRGSSAPELDLDDPAPGGLRHASDTVLAGAGTFPPDRAERPTSITPLLDPAILDYARKGWVGY